MSGEFGAMPTQERSLGQRIASYAAVSGSIAVAALGAHTDGAQAAYAPTPDQQGLIDQSLAVSFEEWEATAPDLVANNPCKGILRVTMGTDVDLFNTEYGNSNQAQALVAPRCEIQLNENLFIPDPNVPQPTVFRPARACEIIKHEVGHILGLGHVDNPASTMNTRGPDPEFFKIASPGCVELNRPIFLSDKEMIKLTSSKTNLQVSMCRTDLLHKNRVYRAYYCAERLVDQPGTKTYDRYVIKTNQPYNDDGQAVVPAMNDAFVTQTTWDNNRKRGAKVLK